MQPVVTTDSLQAKSHFEESFASRYAVVSLDSERKIVLCTITCSYIPMAEFQTMFRRMAELIAKEQITKFIFDKRLLTAFHQPSMEWYHLVWKEEMYQLGMRQHRKLLPNDRLFEHSVEVGRQKIKQNHPDFKFERYDIRYCKSLEEALSE